MALNATPEYEKAEARFRAAQDPQDELEALQEMLRLIPKHKASEKKQADIKRKISTLRKDLAHGAGSRSSAGVLDPYHIAPGGAGQVVLAGLPNTGKSSIVAAVSSAPVKVADYPFTTATPVPGMWRWQDVQIQLVDTPPFSAGSVEGGMVNLLHRCDAVAIVVDLAAAECLEQADAALATLAERGIELFDAPVEAIPAESPDGKPALLVATHTDQASPEDLATLQEFYQGRLKVCGVACAAQAGFDALGGELWRLLNVIRVYTKRPGQKPDLANPFTLHHGAVIDDLARSIHRDLPEKIRFARIWGEGRFDGQQVHRTEELRDRDVVELHE